MTLQANGSNKIAFAALVELTREQGEDELRRPYPSKKFFPWLDIALLRSCDGDVGQARYSMRFARTITVRLLAQPTQP